MNVRAKKLWVMSLSFALATILGINLILAEDNEAQRARLIKTMNDGNVKDALQGFKKLALDPNDEPGKVAEDMNNAIACLQRLNSLDEVDEFREKVVEVHSKNWRLLSAAAQSVANDQHYGYIVAGKFERGYRRGEGRYVSSQQRDRVRALQLMNKAKEMVKDEPANKEAAQCYMQFANLFLHTGQPWQLQTLTDLSVLPDYDDPYQMGYGGQGAPVDADGKPVFYHAPKSYAAASNDGERWRWLMLQAQELDAQRTGEVMTTFAQFLQSQFDVRTIAGFGRFAGGDDDDDGNESGPYAVSTLAEDETIARLASGIKRFKLPDEFNYIKIYQQLARENTGGQGLNALQQLGQIFEDRQQYDRAVEYWKQVKAAGDPGNHFQQRIDQIVGNWGTFEPAATQPAGDIGANLQFRFRNGNKVSFVATPIDIPRFIADMKKHISSKPKNVDWHKINIEGIGYRLVEHNETEYLKTDGVEKWDLELKPRDKHFDRRVSVKTPLKKAGAYVVTGKMANGNTSRIVVWVADTTIIKKQLDKQSFYFVADAVTGKPVPNAKLDFFGYRQIWNNNNTHDIVTSEMSHTTDKDGQLLIAQDQNVSQFQWMITASTAEGRFANLGFTSVWFNQYYDQQYQAVKIFGMTDRPVYRPLQSVKFKAWLANAKYDQEGKSTFANQAFQVLIHNPKGEKILDKSFTTDEWGGFDGEFPLPKDATLGQYAIVIPARGQVVSFRVEEYKKPEFEVKVDAPTEPVMLGEKLTATINAKYYFGAPVAEGRMKYKVMRTEHSANWYPRGEWDWYYEPGYWWFAPDYNWYPGFREWGCKAPRRAWWGWHRQQPPEIVMENDVALAADGTVKIEIDTALAKAMHGNTDHKYEITAEVTDNSRRTITGAGTVMVARKPFKVYAWVDKGHYVAGDAIEASFSAQTLANKPVKGKGTLKLFKVTYDEAKKPIEKAVQEWALDTDDQGAARQQMKAAEPGQYRVSYTVADEKKHEIEGGYVFNVVGAGFDSANFRFNDLELITEKREYDPAEKVKLMVNTNRADAAVLLFVRAVNGVCLPPKLLNMAGKSVVEEIEVLKKDMPNFFVEAMTVSGGRIFSEVREIVVPPESRVTNVEVLPSQAEYKPGEKAKMKLKLTDVNGEPVAGTNAITIYDKSVEYISGGSNVPEIKAFFWKWRRSHHPQSESTLQRMSGPLWRNNEPQMGYLGAFGAMVADGDDDPGSLSDAKEKGLGLSRGGAPGNANKLKDSSRPESAAAAPMEERKAFGKAEKESDREGTDESKAPPPDVQPTVRKNFADTAFWSATINTGINGIAEVDLTMPESLTTWKVKVWSMSTGTRVGQGEAEVITKKNLIVRLQAPRFFTQTDEVVLSANVHNYLATKKSVKVALQLDGGALQGLDALERVIEVDSKGELRVDWRVKVLASGQPKIGVRAITDEESDAMEMTFPAYIHGMNKMDSFAGNMRPDKETASVKFSVPAQRIEADSRVEVRYSPTLAGAMVDALPYMVDYPYGCTEQTLSRFLPTVITQKILQRMNVDLKDVQAKITNLNAQEIGDDIQRAGQWKRYNINPVFDTEQVKDMVKAGITRLASMQCADGGWGWFSGHGEYSYVHTTAYVVHGLQIARNNDVALPPGMLDRGVTWLKNYQAEQLRLLNNPKGVVGVHHKEFADNVDAFVYMVLADENVQDKGMMDHLYNDRTQLAVYAMSMLGLAFNRQKQAEKLEMILKNIGQFLVEDNENQTAYLKLPDNNYYWYWYGSEYEAQGYYLKLLSATDPKSEKASRLVKYLINNRKNATYWNSTRDTAVCIEAMADYLKASGEDSPDMTLEIWLDGKKSKEVAISASNLFTFDNQFLLTGKQVTSGEHTLEFKRKGKGPVYFNAYVSNFTLEDHITKAGLEIKVDRKYYKLKKVDKEINVAGARGQAVGQKVEKYEREELPNLSTLKSGDLVEIELVIDSKNDYEYIMFEDMKAAGFEPVDTRSGYNGNDMGAYMELRDERVCFFARALARGKHSVSYRMRAEIPGRFSALPTRASAMYAPELRGNSDEIKFTIKD
jgi:alpha-2-macroglobulin